ncbi:pyridoxal-phosphate dependent enzyme [Cryobacterium sp. Hh38]|nr:pyridoxal-phosphate dependent enzyme [Cryobacterium sp. Hh38]
MREDVLASVAGLVGNTPLVELRVLAAGLPARVLVKLEGSNPGGSAKDRLSNAADRVVALLLEILAIEALHAA